MAGSFTSPCDASTALRCSRPNVIVAGMLEEWQELTTSQIQD